MAKEDKKDKDRERYRMVGKRDKNKICGGIADTTKGRRKAQFRAAEYEGLWNS